MLPEPPGQNSVRHGIAVMDYERDPASRGSRQWYWLVVGKVLLSFYLQWAFHKKEIHFFEMWCQNNPKMPHGFFFLQNNGLGNVLTYWVTLIRSVRKWIEPLLCVRHHARPRVGYKISQMQRFWSKSLCSNTAFQPLFLLPCSTWQMTFLFLIQSPGHTQGYSQCDASEWERHGDGINLNPFLHVKKKEPCPLQAFHIY